MCYSAMVKQNCKKLGLQYDARVDLDEFGRLFEERLKGSGAKIGPELEKAFLDSPQTPTEVRIQKLILEWRAQELEQWKHELDQQESRLTAAEAALAKKVTKKAQEEVRIATKKIEALKDKIEFARLAREPQDEARIWSKYYAPLVVEVGGKRWVRPFRYLFRPAGADASFEKKFFMLYNARSDNLRGPTWGRVYGKHHGLLTVKSFFEQCGERGEVKFEAKSGDELAVPTLFERNVSDAFVLDSFALITGDPNPEVLRAGHDRTPIVLKPENVSRWLHPGASLQDYDQILADRQKQFFTDEDVG
jgi:putative SOS response-associated peptidase YedK